VGTDARVSVEGVAYEVEPDLAGETVVLWWGLFDNELYVEKDDQRYGPFYPVDGPIPLHRYRKFKKTKTEERADKIADLAKKLGLPRTALDKNADLQFLVDKYKELTPTVTPFNDPDPYQEFTYPTILFAKRAISEQLAKPLAKLSTEQLAFIDALLAETLNKKVIIERVRQYFHSNSCGEQNAHALSWNTFVCFGSSPRLGTTRQNTKNKCLRILKPQSILGKNLLPRRLLSPFYRAQIDDLEPTLTRHGYDVRGLAEQFNAKPAEIKLLFRGQLDPARSRELHEQMLAAGLPL
jgi:hypothetical protein